MRGIEQLSSNAYFAVGDAQQALQRETARHFWATSKAASPILGYGGISHRFTWTGADRFEEKTGMNIEVYVKVTHMKKANAINIGLSH